MAQINGKMKFKDAMNIAALGEYADMGFSLNEPDDHSTELWFKGKKIATYISTKLTIPVLYEDCQNFLSNTTGG